MSARVIVVGSVNVDLVASVKRLPARGETVTGASFARHHGGKGANQAVAAARLGARTAFVGAVGDDAFGAEARSALLAENIDLDGLRTVAGPTGVALILVDAGGENVIAVASGANAQLTPEAVRGAFARLPPGPGDVVLVGHEIPTPVARAALKAGREAGATTILNPAPATGLDRSALALADILTPNRGELIVLVAEDARRTGAAGGHDSNRPDVAARRLLESSAEGEGVRQAVIVTLGSAGAVLVSGDGPPLDVAAPHVAAVDSVGAGDAFNGALAAGLASGLDLEAAARRAIRAAAISTTHPGARGGMPSATELDGAVDPREG